MSGNISIAEAVLGVPPSLSGYKAATRAYQTLTGETISAGQLKKANMAYEQCSDEQRITMSVDEADRLITASGLYQIFVAGEIQNSSVLTDWLTYVQLMKYYGRRADGSASALLLGCQSTLSAKAFTVLAREEYGANRPYIVDLYASEHTRRIGNFVLADALRLPFRPGSMDFVQTNQLFYRLYDSQDPHASVARRTARLFSEAVRVLAPGGQLLLREVPPVMDGYQPPSVSRSAMVGIIAGQLSEEGFTGIKAAMPIDSVVPDFLFDPNRDLATVRGYASDYAMMLYARKPEA